MTDPIFYDIETFAHNALIVLKDIDKKLIGYWWDTFDGLHEALAGKVGCGYNNYFYDDYILSRMLNGGSPEQLKELNDAIIGKQNHAKYVHRDITSIDCFQQIDVSMPGLKRIEGNMGRMILESSVPFDIDRPLTEQEKEEVLTYCMYDVDTTIDVYKMRKKSYFMPKAMLTERLGNERARRWNTTTISANLLLSRPLPKWAYLRVPEWMMDLVPEEVREMWLNLSSNLHDKKQRKKTTIRDFGNIVDFSLGGLHSVHEHIKVAENVKLLDVASMYPYIVINLNVLGEGTKVFKEIVEERIKAKHAGDEVTSEGLKLVINSVTGNLENEYSILYNPRAAMTVRIYGQIALYELCRRLAPFATIIQANTDGVAFTCDNDLYKQIWADWERDFNLTLEEKAYTKIIQKDVNNYIAVKPNGDLTCKGGDVAGFKGPRYFKSNSTRIVDLAIVNKLVYGQDPIATIQENLENPIEFQYILQAGNTFKGTFDDEGTQYNKINRVFAVKKDGVCLHKKRMDNGLVKFPDAPDRMMVWNRDCDDIDIKEFRKNLDITHYYQLINKKLAAWPR